MVASACLGMLIFVNGCSNYNSKWKFLKVKKDPFLSDVGHAKSGTSYSIPYIIVITGQPQDQFAAIEATNVSFNVLAEFAPSFVTNTLHYQWQFNGTLLDDTSPDTNFFEIPDATNSFYHIPIATTNTVGFYRVIVSGSPAVTSLPASFTAYGKARFGTVPVYGVPYSCSNCSFGSCPGAFGGYISYPNKTQYYPAVPSSPHMASATDPLGRASAISYHGNLGDGNCVLSSSISFQTQSPGYQFTLYFTTAPPTGQYILNLVGF